MRNIHQEYYRATECQLATMSRVAGNKSSSKYSVERHNKISFDMLIVCGEINDEHEAPNSEHHLVNKFLNSDKTLLRAYFDYITDIACDKNQKTIEEQDLGGYANR